MITTPPQSRVPDSRIATAATDLLVASSTPTLVNHCLRTYQFGLALADLDGLRPDPELFYLGAALHDLGLTERFAGAAPFEQVGADAAGTFLVAEGYPAARADAVAEAIRLHLELATGRDPRPEVALIHLGAAIDVFGLGLDRIAAGATRRIIEEHPRLGFTQAVTALLAKEAVRQPVSRTASLVRNGAAGLIAATPFDD